MEKNASFHLSWENISSYNTWYPYRVSTWYSYNRIFPITQSIYPICFIIENSFHFSATSCIVWYFPTHVILFPSTETDMTTVKLHGRCAETEVHVAHDTIYPLSIHVDTCNYMHIYTHKNGETGDEMTP